MLRRELWNRKRDETGSGAKEDGQRKAISAVHLGRLDGIYDGHGPLRRSYRQRVYFEQRQAARTPSLVWGRTKKDRFESLQDKDLALAMA